MYTFVTIYVCKSVLSPLKKTRDAYSENNFCNLNFNTSRFAIYFLSN